MSNLIHLDLFSGIGGFRYALQLAGIEPDVTYYSDIEEYGNAVYAKHYPDAIALGDIRSIDGEALKRKHGKKATWIITGGFPCVQISEAGSKVGIVGKDSGLWSEMHRLIGQVRPAVFVAENVGALTYRGLNTVLRDVAATRYDAEWSVIPASQIGAAHIRKRIWIVGYPTDTSSILCGQLLSQAEEQSDLAIGDKPNAKTNGLLLRTKWAKEVERCSANPKPYLMRAANGLPEKLDEATQELAVATKDDIERVAACGNAIVPQIAAMILERCKILL